MKSTSRLTMTLMAGAALAGCHHRQADPVYTQPTETVITTTTSTMAPDTIATSTTTQTSTGMSSMAGTRRDGSATANGARSERRELHLAMTSIERARRELERSGHEFGGHKTDAMKASGTALHELRLASGQESREERGNVETASERRVEGRELHLALVDLERARSDMEHARHDFSGRRRETIEAVDAAIREIRLAAEFEK